jgi:hypothetical protein
VAHANVLVVLRAVGIVVVVVVVVVVPDALAKVADAMSAQLAPSATRPASDLLFIFEPDARNQVRTI